MAAPISQQSAQLRISAQLRFGHLTQKPNSRNRPDIAANSSDEMPIPVAMAQKPRTIWSPVNRLIIDYYWRRRRD
jgi:hypothetical protein